MKHEQAALSKFALSIAQETNENDNVTRFKGLIATEIVKRLDADGLTVREAHARTGIAAADFSRIRNADLDRFTLDRLLSIITRLGIRIEVEIKLIPGNHDVRHAIA